MLACTHTCTKNNYFKKSNFNKKKKIHITVCGLKLEKQTHITAIAEYTIYFLNPKIILDSRDYLKKIYISGNYWLKNNINITYS